MDLKTSYKFFFVPVNCPSGYSFVRKAFKYKADTNLDDQEWSACRPAWLSQWGPIRQGDLVALDDVWGLINVNLADDQINMKFRP